MAVNIQKTGVITISPDETESSNQDEEIKYGFYDGDIVASISKEYVSGNEFIEI
jgi:hypothetical protein